TDEEEHARHLVLAADGPKREHGCRGGAGGRSVAVTRSAGNGGRVGRGVDPIDSFRACREHPSPPDCGWVPQGHRWRDELRPGTHDRGPGRCARRPQRADLLWRLAMLTFSDGDLCRAVELLEEARTEAGTT